MIGSWNAGERASFNGALCTIRFVGEVNGTTGQWLGVEWDDPSRGKHDGSHKGVQYFKCKPSKTIVLSQRRLPSISQRTNPFQGSSKLPTPGSFIRPSRPADVPRSFIRGLYDKYAPSNTKPQENSRIVISGKVAEEVGFDVIRQKQAQLEQLKIVILDGMQIAFATGELGESESKIREKCPLIAKLDLSRNLFRDLRPLAGICKDIPLLQSLCLK